MDMLNARRLSRSILKSRTLKIVESIYNQVYDKYSPEMPPELIKDLFESRTTPELGWAQGKPLLDLDQFVDRSTSMKC